uniref:Uncharacterized protein n=1 Tax=Timema cristinae TaxID=61476 RepID=A0A7R9DHB2_TIMCR|nr:unnamed protein product [Timema cristinae]
MWAACELGLSLLPNFPKGSGKVKTPEKFLLPVYFEPLSQTAWTDYIPTSLAKKLKSGKGGQRSATSSLEFSDLLEVQPPGDMRVDAEDEESEASEEMEEEKNIMEVDEYEDQENVITYHGSLDDSTVGLRITIIIIIIIIMNCGSIFLYPSTYVPPTA